MNVMQRILSIIRLIFYGCNETVAKIVEKAPGPYKAMHTEHPQK